MFFQVATSNGAADVFGAIFAAIIAGFYGVFFLFYCLIGLFALLSFIAWVLALVDCIKRDFPNHNDKVMWILVIALTHVLGAIIYYFVVYRKTKQAGKEAQKPPEPTKLVAQPVPKPEPVAPKPQPKKSKVS